MKKVLIITYYWPPAGGPGVQRWLKFVKYFSDFNIVPVVYTVENQQYPIVDPSLVAEVPPSVEVLSQPIWEPNKILSMFGLKNSESAGFLNPKPSLIGKLARYIRANYFIPDARKYWVKPSVEYLEKYLKKNKVDAVITTGPPHSLHLIGLQLKKLLGIKWIADFRDPWTQIDYFHQLPLSKKAERMHHYLEKEVLKNADTVLVVGDVMNNKFSKVSNNVITVTNGYDEEPTDIVPELDTKFTLTHIGSMNTDRNPKMLWDVLADILVDDQEFSNDFMLKLIGNVAAGVLTDIASHELSNHVEIIDYLPHNEVMELQKKSQVLLLIVNNVPNAEGIITGKIFEYLIAKRPILAIAPRNGDLMEIINTTNSGMVVDFEDRDSLKNTILELYSKFKRGKLIIDSKNIGQYHRRNLTKKVSEIIMNLSD